MDLQNPEERSRFIQTLERLVTNTMIIEREEVKRMTETKTVDWKEALKLRGVQKPDEYAAEVEARSEPLRFRDDAIAKTIDLPCRLTEAHCSFSDESGKPWLAFGHFSGVECRGSWFTKGKEHSVTINNPGLSFDNNYEFELFLRAMYELSVELGFDETIDRAKHIEELQIALGAAEERRRLVEKEVVKAKRAIAEYTKAGLKEVR